jgi:nitrogen fixation NifU-like protein
MSLDELYREIILDHYKNPRNRGRIDDPSATAGAYNPLCGDEVDIYIKIADGRIVDIRFEGRGCSISQSSASMLTEAVKNRTVAEAEALADEVRGMLLGEREPGPDLGDLEALQGVRKFPVRIKCAILSWNTLKDALASYRAGVVRGEVKVVTE